MKKRFLLVPFMAVALVFSLFLAGCGGTDPEQLIREDLEARLGEVDELDEAMATGLEESVGDDLDSFGITAEEFSTAYLDGFGYEIGDITVDGDTATAEVTITVKSYNDIMSALQTDFGEWLNSEEASAVTSEEELYQELGSMLIEAVQNTEATQNTLTVDYTKDGDEWTMDSSSMSEINALFGA
ncbi:DUF5105 domain-containing protein [Enorma phocaeensis]|uniref:DUF5105 domain-containing protein n=1 Tax=Enorma phocaeensis TaxID=1871019 RepID=UPI00235501E8|nr:DUF5105 domain-containing protein [Enorma phocaeensis]